MVTAVLFWWMCSATHCLTHQATYADMEACRKAAAQVEHSVCL